MLDVALLATLKLAVGACVLRAGFTHVSDDDYARTVIAEQFARSPRFDPSGTSWLPLPFWIAGAVMAVAGRSLAVARGIAIALSTLSVAAPYAAMRVARVPRTAALAASAIGVALPWNAWLGVSTVPEGWTGALLAAALIAMIDERAMPWAAAGLLAAALSRYEAWPACAALVLRCAVPGSLQRSDPSPGPSTRTARRVSCALVALAGPALWMAWNAHAHGSALHFLARVSTFRRAIGAADVPVCDKLLDYPRALVEESPEAAVLGACGAAGLLLHRDVRGRWAWPAGAALGVMVFLVLGDLGDGAPTHHPARALGLVSWVLVGAGADAILAATLVARGTRCASPRPSQRASLPSRGSRSFPLAGPRPLDEGTASGARPRSRAGSSSAHATSRPPRSRPASSSTSR